MFQTSYFPSISIFSTMYRSPDVIIDAAEHFQKNSLRNRCYLASSQGKVLLSVPLRKGKHQQMPIRDIKISYDFDWVKVHLGTIEVNYRKAPFYPHFKDDIHSLLESKPKYLLDLNWDILLFIGKVFQWHPAWSYSLNYEHDKKFTPLPVIYPQLFEDQQGFIPDLSILDLILCIGPQVKFFKYPE